MTKKLFVGNLPFDVNDADLVKVFSVVGKVASARVVTNKKTGRSQGFAFVEMATDELALETVKVFEGATLNERSITVQVSTPKDEKDVATAAAKETASAAEAPATETAPAPQETASAETAAPEQTAST